MKKIKLYLSAFIFVGLLWSCDSDSDDLGLQFFDGAEGKTESYDIAVYNIDGGILRSDSYVLQKATLGAFTEEQFGMQKSEYVSQVRLSSYAPDFGINPVVDSVVLEIQPEYDTDKNTIKTSTLGIQYNGVDAIKTVNSYKTLKYGNENKSLTINVKEVLEDLGKVGDEIFSNKKIKEGQNIGTKKYDGYVSSVTIKKKIDESILLSKNVGLRVPLEASFFQTKILNKNGASELASESAFVEYFKGLKIEIQEEDGHFITFSPNNVSLRMYYTYGDVGKRTSTSYDFNLGAINVHFSQISSKKNNPFNNAISKANTTNGDSLLYLQGLGGSGVGVKLTGNSLEELKKIYREKGSVILSAKLRLYIDTNTWSNSYTKPNDFLVKEQGTSDFITGLKTMYYNTNYKLITAYTSAPPAYYDINITKTVKDIVENGVLVKDLVINVGSYLTKNGALIKEEYNTGIYSPYRVILVGTDATNQNKAQLLITRISK